MNSPTPTPDFERLVALASGEVAPAEADAIESAAERSHDDSRTLAWLRAAIAAMRTDDATEPTPQAVARARGVFRHGRAESRPTLPLRNWLAVAIEAVATLIHDSRREPALAGLRGEEDGYRLSFATAECDVDLLVEPLPGGSDGRSSSPARPEPPGPNGPVGPRVRVLGQVSSDGVSPRSIAVALAGTREVLAEVESDEHGVFSVTVAPGRYDLLLLGDRGAVMLPNLVVP